MDKRLVILFDGVCNLCNTGIQSIIKKDKKRKFRFASLQGEKGQSLLREFNLTDNNLDSFVLIEGDKAYTRSTAALRIAKITGGFWKILYGLIIVPRFMRDAVYNLIARNRYRWFGRKDECMIPTPELRDRFLD
jgi:predicted DCC family thiol-disulfide oxidoreductase YuxK